MKVVYILLPLAIIIALGFIISFVWAVKTGQMDDLDTPALRILEDEDTIKSSSKKEKVSKESSESSL